MARNFRMLAAFACLSGGFYATAARITQGKPGMMTPTDFALLHAYEGGGGKRGKHKSRRHGAKLRSNRLTISRRVRRKHRRAA